MSSPGRCLSWHVRPPVNHETGHSMGIRYPPDRAQLRRSRERPGVCRPTASPSPRGTAAGEVGPVGAVVGCVMRSGCGAIPTGGLPSATAESTATATTPGEPPPACATARGLIR
jgi:hypothetical protein